MADPIDLKPGHRVKLGIPRLVSERQRNGPSIPAFKPTQEHRNMVYVFASNSASTKVIAQALGISVSTVEKYFKQEITLGREYIVARVGAVVVKEALAGNIGAARYWLSTHGGPEWRMPKDAYTDPEHPRGEDDVVHFYMPPNGRDQPEIAEEPPTIDGEVEKPTGTDDA